MAEVAGLVLGAIPPLHSALEHSGDITGPIDRLFRWKRYKNWQIRQLNYCSVSYDQALRILLKGVVDDEELSYMLQDPQCESWGRLGLETAYDSCMSAIWEIASSIDRLGGATQIHQTGLRGVLNGSPPSQSPLGRIKHVDFATVNQHPEDAPPFDDPLQCNEIDRNNIATLGVMILELQSGRSIEEFRTPEDGPCSTCSNLLVATRVLDKLYHRGSISEGPTRAVTYCLQSSIHPATSLMDDQFVDTFIEQTVGPLEKERRVLMG
ncbi:hypothetical protein PG996_002581 [Apiospora saccharicola]|uniref:Protein kinase domain-containing protein n=1 Tax=Apiospora saccharicola TaxID=335842 RepID=A0ABR1WJV4_9PEZI